MMKEQMSQSPSVVCIHMNVDNKAQPCGKDKNCVCREFCNTHGHVAPDSPRRKRKKRRRKKGGRVRSHSGSSESLSSTDSSGILWKSDIENSKPQGSASNSTSASTPRNDKSAAHGQGILREDPSYSASKSKSKRKRHKSHSHSRNSHSDSPSASSADSREGSKRRHESKHKRTSPHSRRNSNVYRRKHHGRNKHSSRRSRKHRKRARSESQTGSSRTSSGSYSDSDLSSASSASQFAPDIENKQPWKQSTSPVQNIYPEGECCSDSDRNQCVENYCHNTYYKPELRSVELINTIDFVNDSCPNYQSSSGPTIRARKKCMNRQSTSPECLVRSRCYMVPTSEIPCIPCYGKPYSQDDHSRRKTHRHESRRKKSPERREGRHYRKHSREKKGVVDRQCLCSCNCIDCIPEICPQFYQCSLLMGQSYVPMTPKQCTLSRRDYR